MIRALCLAVALLPLGGCFLTPIMAIQGAGLAINVLDKVMDWDVSLKQDKPDKTPLEKVVPVLP